MIRVINRLRWVQVPKLDLLILDQVDLKRWRGSNGAGEIRRGPDVVRRYVLIRVLLPSALDIFVDQALVFLGEFLVDKNALDATVIKAGSSFSLKTGGSVPIVRGAVQFFLHLLKFSHQVELGLWRPEVKHPVIVRLNHPTKASLSKDPSLYGRGETLRLWCDWPRGR